MSGQTLYQLLMSNLQSWCECYFGDSRDGCCSAGLESAQFRAVVEMQYRAGIVWVKFVGTHAEYDRIDVENVNEY